jgi:hypothetical protein
MVSSTPKRIARAAGLAVGVGAATAVLVAASPSSDFSRLPATVRVSVAPSGELEAVPSAPRKVLATRSLSPEGGTVAGAFSLRNQSGAGLAVRLRARAASRELDGLLRVRVRSGRKTLASTTLQGLRAGTTTPLHIAPGAERPIRVEAWIPPGTEGYEGRQVSVSLAPVSKPER